MVDTRRSAPCFAFSFVYRWKWGEEKTKGKKRREKQKYFNNRDCCTKNRPSPEFVRLNRIANVLHPSNFWYSAPTLFANNYRLSKYSFSLYFLSLLPSLSFIPFQILFTSFSFRCWQIRDFFFLFSSPRACFLYSTISLELVLSTVNILPLSLHFLFPELFPPPPPPRVVFYYRWIPPPPSPPRSLPVIPPGNPFPSCSATNVKIFQSLNFIAIPTPSQGAHITEEEKLLREWYITSGDPTTWSLLARWSDSRHYEWFLTKVDRPPCVIEKYLRG